MYKLNLDRELAKEVFGNASKEILDWVVNAIANIVVADGIIDKHELEDNLPKIYQEVLGEEYPGAPLDDNLIFGEEEIEVLKSVTGEEKQLFELVRELINVERQYQTMSQRTGLYNALEQSFKRNLFSDKDEAVNVALERHNQKKGIPAEVEKLTPESSDFIRPVRQGQLFPDNNDN